jgi:hypothetical protein
MRIRLGLAAALLGLSVEAHAAPKSAHPDLTGVWTSTSLTELERPAAFKSLTVSDAEAVAYETARPKEFLHPDKDDEVGGRGSEGDFWDVGAKLARIGGRARTSWIVEPADGRLPYRPEGLAAKARDLAAHANSDNPETRNVSERCLVAGWAGAGPPMLNPPYANAYQIVQTGDAVAIQIENMHDVRIVRLAGPPLPPGLRPWLGDSRGRWQGSTLVVETTRFNPGDALKIPTALYVSPDARVTERFTKTAPDTLIYEFAVDDPAIYSRPWRAQMVFHAMKGPIYEFACHEGNYSLPGILAGARREEKLAAAAR